MALHEALGHGKMKKVIFYCEPNWAFGSIHTELAKYLWPLGIDCKILPWNQSYTWQEMMEMHGDFILALASPHDWRTPQNTNLWQGVNGVNNPCPSGYRLPTDIELDNERKSWKSNDATGAFASELKLPLPGGKNESTAQNGGKGNSASYWSSTVSSGYSRLLAFDNSTALTSIYVRGVGLSVRCIKD